MKKNIKLFLAAGAALLAAGCTDLNVPVESQYTGLLDTEAAIESNMAGVYFKFRDPLGRRFMEAMTLSSDEWTSLAYSGNWVDGYAYAHTAYHNFTYETATLDWMNVLGKANVLCNEVINSNYDDKYKIGARAMRCFYTFIMMDCWGDVVIPDSKYITAHNLDMNNRHKRADIARWLDEELNALIPLLPTTRDSESYGKPDKYMAQALLAKIYTNWAVYTCDDITTFDAKTAKNEKLKELVTLCDELINATDADGKKLFELGPDQYRFKFNHDNTERVMAGTIKDFIYAMPYDTQLAQGMQWGRSHVYKDVKKMEKSYFGEKLNNSGGAYMTLTPECVSRFNLKGDQRNFMIAGLCDKDGNDAQGQVYVYDPQTLLPTDEKALNKDGEPLIFTKNITVTGEVASNDVGDDKEGWRQGYRSTKWFICDADYSNGRNQSNDVPIFRYADILLMKAEALVRDSQTGAKELFNQIRTYAGAEPLDHEPSLEEIYDERGREFFDEIWRRNDMIRFGHFEDEWFPHYKNNENAKFGTHLRVFPIQKSDLDVNSNWTQNPGYNN